MPNQPDTYEDLAAHDLAILDRPFPDTETHDLGLAMLDKLKKVVVAAGLTPKQRSDQTTRFTFEVAGDLLELRFIPSDVTFQLTLKPEGEADEAQNLALAYDRLSKTFVGTQLEQDIGLEPDKYRPRKTPTRVFAEAVTKAVEAVVKAPAGA